MLQATALLGLYQAELARVLCINCADIGQLASGRQCLQPGTLAWRQARLFIRLYQALYSLHAGNGPAMCHWLHVPQPGLGGEPHLLLIDDGRLADVVHCVEQAVNPAAGA